MMRFHCLQHVPSETAGNIESWINEKQHALSYTRFFDNTPLPAQDQFDALIIMGGFMSVHDEKDFPWLQQEKAFIATAIQQQKKIIGICLGAQLLAEVSGALVYTNPEKEIGFMPVHFTQAAKQHPLFKNCPDEITVFHWHGETFHLPGQAVHLAFTPVCTNQAWLLGDNLLGLQFHLEVTPQIVQDMVIQDGHELVPAPNVHTAQKILNELHYLAPNKIFLYQLLDVFFNT